VGEKGARDEFVLWRKRRDSFGRCNLHCTRDSLCLHLKGGFEEAGKGQCIVDALPVGGEGGTRF